MYELCKAGPAEEIRPGLPEAVRKLSLLLRDKGITPFGIMWFGDPTEVKDGQPVAFCHPNIPLLLLDPGFKVVDSDPYCSYVQAA